MERSSKLYFYSQIQRLKRICESFVRWKRQISDAITNYSLPASQGPQDTQGRDKSYGLPMNPYERPPITDWSEQTTD